MSPTVVQEEVPARRATNGMQVLSVRTLLLGAALALFVAVLLWVAVIPQVLRDTFPQALPQQAAASFRVVALLFVVVGIATLAVSRVPAAGAFVRRALLPAIGGVLTVLVGLLLIDAAASFRGHGPAMRWVAMTLWGCVVLAVIAGASLIVSGVTSRRG